MAGPTDEYDYKRCFKLRSQAVSEMKWGPPKKLPDYSPTGPKQTSTGDARSHSYGGYKYNAGHLVPDILDKFGDIYFSDTATSWEQNRSTLCDYGGDFTPVVADTPFLSRFGLVTVVAHVGSVNGRHICFPKGSPGSYVKEKLALGVPVFVMRQLEYDRPKYENYFSELTVDVVATVDGRIMQVLGQRSNPNAEAEDGPIEFVRDWIVMDKLVRLAGTLGTRLLKVLELSPAEGRVVRLLMDGPTEEVATLYIKNIRAAGIYPTVREIGLDAAMEARGLRFGGWEERMGIPRAHLGKMVEASRETNMVGVFRANKKVAIPLIEQGARGKPKALSIPGFKSSAETGVLTAKTAEQIKLVTTNKYYLLEMQGGKPMMRLGTELKSIPRTPYWTVEEGQVLDADGNPFVGDYDGLGGLPLESPGRNLGLVPNDLLHGDWMGADWKRYMEAVNPKLDKMRVLHGAQDGFPDIEHAGKYGGLTNDVAYAVFPDGRVIILNGKAEQQAFYEAFERQTAVGSYSPKLPSGSPPVDELAARRALKK